LPCPYYKQGLCTSPLVGEPRADVCQPGVCDGDSTRYSRCPYYVKTQDGLEVFTRERGEPFLREKPLPILHYIKKPVKSQCPFFKTIEREGYYLAYCEVLGRLLTRYEVDLCSSYSDTCPLRRMAVKSLGTQLGRK